MATSDGTTAKLTARQARFVEEYQIDANGTQAAIRAGYSPDTARAIASENLTNPNMALAIQKARAHAREHANVSREMVVDGLYEAATAPKASWGNRIAAWMGLAKVLGYIVDRQRVEGLVEHEHSFGELSKADLMVLVEEGRAARAEREGRMLEGEAREL